MFDTAKIKTKEMLQAEQQANELATKISEAKKYLSDTDFKMTVDYFSTLTKELQEELTRLRSEARQFIRANNA